MKVKNIMLYTLLLALSAPIFTPVFAASFEDVREALVENERSIGEMEEEREALSAALDSVNEEMMELTLLMKTIFGEISEKKMDLTRLNEEMLEKEMEIEKMDAVIRELEASIGIQYETIGADQSELEEMEERVGERIRSTYKNGSMQNILFVILESDGLMDLFERIKFAEVVVSRDHVAMDNIREKMGEMEEGKSALENSRRRLVTERSASENRRSSLLDTKYRIGKREAELKESYAQAQELEEEKRAAIERMSSEETRLSQEIGDTMTENALLESELQRLTELSQMSMPSLQGYIRPTPGRLTSPFGYRIHPIWKDKRFHKGIDLASPMGTAIGAAKDGTVLTSTYLSSYGNTVILDHGGGETSLYAHLDRLGVKVGENVSRGETLGTVGSTGDSTGPHLHFEIRVGGQPVNPSEYFN